VIFPLAGTPEVPFGLRVKTISKLMRDGGLGRREIREQFIGEFTMLIAELLAADPKLFYRIEDMGWFAQVMSGGYATVTMSMLFACASRQQAFLTPAQFAEATGDSESKWRSKAASNELVGAFKAGKQWFIPVTSLRAYGISVVIPGQVVREDEGMTEAE
jgi:hypothetical protein